MDEPYNLQDLAERTEYIPTIKNRVDGTARFLTSYAGTCISNGKIGIYAKQIDQMVKVFTNWGGDKYMLGRKEIIW